MTIPKMKSAVCIVLLCSVDLCFGEANTGVRSIAASDASYVTASVGSKKELSCTTHASISHNQVSWYRITNSDISRCPSNALLVFDGPSVFCDRLTNNRNVQPGFRQRFSVPPSGTENENGLIITRVELSDAGMYACVGFNNSKILARINFTIEDDSTSTAAFSPKGSLSSSTNDPHATSTHEILSTNSSIQNVGSEHRSTADVSTVATICLCCAAVVIIIAIIVTIVFLKRRKLKEERHEMGSSKDVVSGNGQITSNQLANNMIEPVYEEIKEYDGAESGLRSAAAAAAGEMRSNRKNNSNDAVKDQTKEDVQSISIYALVKSDITENEKSEARRTTVTMATTDPIYSEATGNDVKQIETCKEGATFNHANMAAFNTIYGEIIQTEVRENEASEDRGTTVTIATTDPIYSETTGNDVKQNETYKEESTFNCATMAAFNPIYGEIKQTEDVTGADATYCKIDDLKETAVYKGLESVYSNAKAIQPDAPIVGLDGTVYQEMKKCNGDGVAPAMQQPKQHFEKSIYVAIDHNETPPHPPPPSVPRRYSCAPPR